MDNRRHRQWLLAAIASLSIGLLVVVLVMLAAWDHNPQEEFHDVTGIRWRAWLTVGGSWLLVISVAAVLPCRALVALRTPKTAHRDAAL